MDDALQAAQERCCVWLWQGVFRRIYDTLLEDNIITVDQVSSFYHVCVSHCQTGMMSWLREQNGLLMCTGSVNSNANLCVAHQRLMCCRLCCRMSSQALRCCSW